MAGFNGTTRADTSDRSKNPMLQDVAVGWLQKYRNEAPVCVISKITAEDGTVISDVIRVGKNGDYENLDALVMDGTNTLIDEIYQDDPKLVAIVGRKLLADKYFPLVNKTAGKHRVARGGYHHQPEAHRQPASRARAVLPGERGIRDHAGKSLSTSWMRATAAASMRTQRPRGNYESMNIDYVVEAYAAGCLLENITLGDFTAPAAPESRRVSL